MLKLRSIGLSDYSVLEGRQRIGRIPLRRYRSAAGRLSSPTGTSSEQVTGYRSGVACLHGYKLRLHKLGLTAWKLVSMSVELVIFLWRPQGIRREHHFAFALRSPNSTSRRMAAGSDIFTLFDRVGLLRSLALARIAFCRGCRAPKLWPYAVTSP